jgi:hypothetical protein
MPVGMIETCKQGHQFPKVVAGMRVRCPICHARMLQDRRKALRQARIAAGRPAYGPEKRQDDIHARRALAAYLWRDRAGRTWADIGDLLGLARTGASEAAGRGFVLISDAYAGMTDQQLWQFILSGPLKRET